VNRTVATVKATAGNRLLTSAQISVFAAVIAGIADPARSQSSQNAIAQEGIP
jgi:hypothetical protein